VPAVAGSARRRGALDVGQHEVEQDHGRKVRRGLRQRLGAVGGGEHLKARPSQVHRHQVADVVFVLHHQDLDRLDHHAIRSRG